MGKIIEFILLEHNYKDIDHLIKGVIPDVISELWDYASKLVGEKIKDVMKIFDEKGKDAINFKEKVGDREIVISVKIAEASEKKNIIVETPLMVKDYVFGDQFYKITAFLKIDL